jgi:hypothetical protein
MNNEIIIRVGSFLAVFSLIALWEIVARRRSLTTSKKVRWFNNLGITSIDALLVRLVFPVLAVNMAIGLSQFRDPNKLTLPWLLVLPFIGDPGRQPINRH